MIIIPRNTDGKYKHDPMGADESRCVICGRPIKDGSGYLIHVHDGGKVAVRPDELDFLYSNRLLTESGDMGLQAIGADRKSVV